MLQNNTHAWEGDSMRRIFAGWHRLLVASVMLPILSNSSVRAEVKLVASFEDPAQLQQWDIRAQAQLTASWATEGRTCLYLRFAGGQGVLTSSGAMPRDWSGWDIIKIDCWNPGPPYSVTMRADDGDGHIATSWYHPLRTGFTTLEFIVPGFAERIDVSDVTYCSLRVDPPVPARDLELYIDNIRFCRNEPREVFRPPDSQPARLAPSIDGNFVANGNFELGLLGWNSWGMWDGGEYRFGTVSGGDVRSGRYAAAIYCDKPGRGGIFTAPFTLPESGTYTLSFYVKAERPGQIGYGYEAPGNAEVHWASATTQWQHITHRFQRQAGFTGRIYIYSRCDGTVYIDEVSFTGPGRPPTVAAATGTPTSMTIEGDKTFLNGKPFFLIGIYRAGPADLAGSAFNCIPAFSQDNTVDPDACHQAGLYLLPDLSGLMRGHVPEQVASAILPLKSHPAVIAWYLCDEPDHEKWNVPPAEMELGTQLLHRADPHHPTVTVVMPWAISNFYRYKDCTDIIATDIYPLASGASPLQVAEKLDILRRATADRKPMWAVVEATTRATVAQEYAVTYLALTHGADGILYWEYSGIAGTAMWPAIRAIADELKLLSPALCAPDAPVQARCSDSRIHHPASFGRKARGARCNLRPGEGAFRRSFASPPGGLAARRLRPLAAACLRTAGLMPAACACPSPGALFRRRRQPPALHRWPKLQALPYSLDLWVR